MNECTPLSREMLPNRMPVTTGSEAIDFRKAKELADRTARSVSDDAMLLAWLDGTTGRFSPFVVCCGEKKPAWLIYAESRGANLSVDVNEGQYVFVYLASEKEV
jgi:hypothetical protein